MSKFYPAINFYGGAFVFAFTRLCIQSGEPGAQPGCFLPLLVHGKEKDWEMERFVLLCDEQMREGYK